MFVDVFLLGIVDSHQGLDRLDHPLSISDEVAIGFFGSEGLELPKQTRQMDDLAVGSAHCTQAVAVSEKFGEFRIDAGLVIALMFNDLSVRLIFVCL